MILFTCRFLIKQKKIKKIKSKINCTFRTLNKIKYIFLSPLPKKNIIKEADAFAGEAFSILSIWKILK